MQHKIWISSSTDNQKLRTKFILGFGVIVYLAISLLSLEANAVSSPSGIVTPNDKEYQGLLFKTEKPRKYLPAPLLGTEVNIDVSGIIARVQVRHYYMNPTDHWIEGIYVFPLADKSAVDTLSMQIGKSTIKGVIKERGQARRIYKKAKSKGQRAALLESQRPNIFRTSVANIGPKDEIIIEIAYQETLTVKNGQFRLRFPMVVGPRYTPKRALIAQLSEILNGVEKTISGEEQLSSPVLRPGQGSINPVKLTVRIESKLPIRDVKSHYHPVTISKPETGPISVKLQDGPVPANRDFELTWSPDLSRAAGSIFTEDWRGEKYGLIMVTPPSGKSFQDSNRKREIIFIIDTSGSMAGTSIQQAKASLRYALSKLGRQDHFNIIQFNSTASALFKRAMPADERSLLVAQAYINVLEAEGGTEMLPAIKLALDGRQDRTRLRQVVFITDGGVSNEAQLFQEIATRLGDTRFFTVGIGSAPNQHFMRRAAKYGRGTFTFIGNLDQAESRMNELLQKLSRPVVTHLSIRPKGKGFVEAYPKMIPDLFIGEPVVVAFRYYDGLKTLEVRGNGPNGQWIEDLSLENALEGKGIPRLWAREKIDDLESIVYWGISSDEVRKEASDVALKYELVTRYTSLVAVDETPARGEGEKLVSKNMPTNLPFGWKYAKVFGSKQGEGMPLMQKTLLKEARNFYQTASVSLKKMAPVAMLQNKTASAATKTLALPQTATPSQLYLIIGLICVFSAILLSLMLRRLGFRR